MLSSHTIKFNLIIGVGNHINNTKNTYTSTKTSANIFEIFFFLWNFDFFDFFDLIFFFFLFWVTIRDHRDSLSAMVGSTLPREWVWYSRYIVTIENEK